MGREVCHYENFQPRQKILIFNILLMLVCVTSMALWIQGSNVVKTNWKTRIKSPGQLKTEVGKIQKSEEVSDMKKLPRVILIGSRHCGAGQRLFLHDILECGLICCKIKLFQDFNSAVIVLPIEFTLHEKTFESNLGQKRS